MLRLTRSVKNLSLGAVRFQSTQVPRQPKNMFVREAERAERDAQEAQKWRGGKKHLNVGVNMSPLESAGRPSENIRVAPETALQYTGRGSHEKTMEVVNRIRRQYEYLPRNREGVSPPDLVSRVAYLALLGTNEPVSGPQHSELTKALSDLYYIDNQLKPQVVKDLLRRFMRKASTDAEAGELETLDDQGRAVTRGRRKTSSARVIVTKAPEGTVGEIRVNGMLVSQFFEDLHHRNEVLFPLSVVQSETKYNVFATTVGGGNSGKSGAVALGIARGLIIHNPLLRKRLSKAGCLTRDDRTKERKKPGLRRARAAYTWVKR
ncbi:37S ribosomal protein S9 [Yarrowia sp. C11]|nr:37S ribosomal protein S9 [Yarrowia sp. E02]KAG5373081.1 37S ribosomal protein S9 [Yarrowia sp. C11]